MVEQQSSGRPGRKFGPVRADTEEYTALATFLRKRVEAAGMTVQALVETGVTGLNKSAISERLAGAKLDAGFVTAVVEACTDAPELRPSRARLLAEGLNLLARAENRRTPVLDLTREKDPVSRNVAVAAQARTIELYEELRLKNGQLDSLNRVRHQSELALRDATALASVLSVWVVVLMRRGGTPQPGTGVDHGGGPSRSAASPEHRLGTDPHDRTTRPHQRTAGTYGP